LRLDTVLLIQLNAAAGADAIADEEA